MRYFGWIGRILDETFLSYFLFFWCVVISFLIIKILSYIHRSVWRWNHLQIVFLWKKKSTSTLRFICVNVSSYKKESWTIKTNDYKKLISLLLFINRYLPFFYGHRTLLSFVFFFSLSFSLPLIVIYITLYYYTYIK